METEPLLRMEHIGKEFFGNRVLADVSFTLRKGEILGLVGENGAGKSTLMNILFGMPVIAQTGGFEGKVTLDGKEVSFADPLDALDAGIGYVHQEFSLIPGFSATENILLNRESTKYNFLVEVFGERLETLDRHHMRERAERAINTLGVDLDPEMVVTEMPVGHRQFTEIAREIDREAMKLLVLDEPTAVLAESEAQVLLQGMKKLASQGIAMIFISHRLQEIMEVCDKILVLRDGRFIQEAKTHETSVRQIAGWMVGRKMEETAEARPADRLQEGFDVGQGAFVVDPGRLKMPVPVKLPKCQRRINETRSTGHPRIGIRRGKPLLDLRREGGQRAFCH